MNKDILLVGVDNIIVNDNGKILLGKRSSNTKYFPNKWNLISGGMWKGESVEDALKREAMEEIGCDIKVLKFVGKYYDAQNGIPTKTIIRLPHICKIVSGAPKALDGTKEVKWFSPKEIKQLDLAFDHNQILEEAGLI
jgi:8-oxo-dGTP diphosphatase